MVKRSSHQKDGKVVRFIFSILLILSGCNDPDGDFIDVHLTRINSTNTLEWSVIYDTFSRCEKVWGSNIAIPLRLVGHSDVEAPIMKDEVGYFWSVYSLIVNKRADTIQLVVAPYQSLHAGYAGLATIESYGGISPYPYAMIWSVPYDSDRLGALMCHEIAHTVGYKHEHGYEFAERGINAIHLYLGTGKERQIRLVRRKYRKALRLGRIKKARYWRRILRGLR